MSQKVTLHYSDVNVVDRYYVDSLLASRSGKPNVSFTRTKTPLLQVRIDKEQRREEENVILRNLLNE